MKIFYKEKEIYEITDINLEDKNKPFMFLLEDGEEIWIPIDDPDFPHRFVESVGTLVTVHNAILNGDN
jgi:hypothetical protein